MSDDIKCLGTIEEHAVVRSKKYGNIQWVARCMVSTSNQGGPPTPYMVYWDFTRKDGAVSGRVAQLRKLLGWDGAPSAIMDIDTSGIEYQFVLELDESNERRVKFINRLGGAVPSTTQSELDEIDRDWARILVDDEVPF